MASLIPVSGEISEFAPPSDVPGVCRMLGATSCEKLIAFDGSSWWMPVPTRSQKNDRATAFYHNRCNITGPTVLFGDVLYLSTKETEALSIGPVVEEYVPVHGRTYDVRDKLKAVGARWFAAEKLWKVPKSRLDEANDIVRKGP